MISAKDRTWWLLGYNRAERNKWTFDNYDNFKGDAKTNPHFLAGIFSYLMVQKERYEQEFGR